VAAQAWLPRSGIDAVFNRPDTANCQMRHVPLVGVLPTIAIEGWMSDPGSWKCPWLPLLAAESSRA
jgi:hypothetical protein